MKSILKFGLPSLLTIWTLTGVHLSIFAQSNGGVKDVRPLTQAEWPKASPLVSIQGDTLVFDFELYYEIPEWKADRLEERLKFTYSELQDVSIDSTNNSVRFKVLETTDATTIDKLFHHFKYRGYEEL